MFYPLGKTKKNLMGGPIHLPPPLVRPRIKFKQNEQACEKG